MGFGRHRRKRFHAQRAEAESVFPHPLFGEFQVREGIAKNSFRK